MTEKASAIGLGAGGHSKVLIEILQGVSGLQIEGLLDQSSARWHQSVLGVPVLGDDQLLQELRERGVTYFFIGLGSVGDARQRRKLFDLAIQHGLKPLDCVHPAACVSPHAEVGRGISAMAGAIINPGARIGENVIINSGAIVEHDCVIGDDVHIATGAHLAGDVSVGNGAHVGVGATVREGIQIGAAAVVGAGAVVVSHVKPGTTVVGVPARLLADSPRRTQSNG